MFILLVITVQLSELEAGMKHGTNYHVCVAYRRLPLVVDRMYLVHSERTLDTCLYQRTPRTDSKPTQASPPNHLELETVFKLGRTHLILYDPIG